MVLLMLESTRVYDRLADLTESSLTILGSNTAGIHVHGRNSIGYSLRGQQPCGMTWANHS